MNDIVMCCVECGSNFTHQGAIDVFMRRHEDASDGLHVFVGINESVVVDRNIQSNPSPRRNGLSVELCCEECGAVSHLNVYQQKGETYVTTTREVG